MFLLRILAYPSQNIITDTRISSYFRKYVFLPQDHGSWVFILSPLLIGIFAGGRFNFALFSLIIAAMATFLLAASLALGLASVLPRLIFILYLVQYYFKVNEKVQVGLVGGMPDILEEQMKAEK